MDKKTDYESIAARREVLPMGEQPRPYYGGIGRGELAMMVERRLLLHSAWAHGLTWEFHPEIQEKLRELEARGEAIARIKDVIG